MRWAIYAFDGFDGATAFASGLRRVGHEVKHRSLWDFNDDCLEAGFDAVATYGLQGKGRRILEEYTAAGVPVVVIDYGYIRRANTAHDWRTGHWQLSVGGLNKVPEFDCNADRLGALGIEIKESGGDPEGYTLICAQTPDDQAHGMTESEVETWCHTQASKYSDAVIRPHPLRKELTYGLPVCEAESLVDALAGARLVITGNSNSGHDALLAGVPALATLRGAAWEPLSGVELPSIERRLSYFSRLAYGQWTWAEFETGDPQRFLIERVMQ